MFLLLRVWESVREPPLLPSLKLDSVKRAESADRQPPRGHHRRRTPTPYAHNPVCFYSPCACCYSVVSPAAASISGCGEAATALTRSLSLKAKKRMFGIKSYDFSNNRNSDGIVDLLLNMEYHGFVRYLTIILFSGDRGMFNWGGTFPGGVKTRGTTLAWLHKHSRSFLLNNIREADIAGKKKKTAMCILLRLSAIGQQHEHNKVYDSTQSQPNRRLK